jgi:hypothetical protein
MRKKCSGGNAGGKVIFFLAFNFNAQNCSVGNAGRKVIFLLALEDIFLQSSWGAKN